MQGMVVLGRNMNMAFLNSSQQQLINNLRGAFNGGNEKI